MEGGPGYAIVINMPQSWLTGYLFETEIDYSRTVIVDANGYAVTSSSFGEIGSRIDSLDFVEMVLNTDSAGYNISFVDNTAMLIVHSNSNAFGHRIITLKPIAEMLQYTPSYIGKLYKSHTNTSIVSRITERRLDASLDLLKKTDINIEALANQCGYSNVTYFYQLFKRKTGVTPGDYRRKFLPNNLT